MKNKKEIINFIKREVVLVIAITLAVITSFISMPKISYIDFKVIVLLFNLMIIVAALKELNVLDNIATSLLKKCSNIRTISFTLVFITFFLSMIVTNDVALITFVPLTLIIGKKANIKTLKLIVFQTLAANLGSALTPMGNPQNLFIYSFYKMKPLEFFKITTPLVLLSLILLSLLFVKQSNDKLCFTIEDIKIKNKNKVVIYCILFLIILLSVFSIISYIIAFVFTIIVVFILDRKLFKKVDYSLLVTFIGFFIFIGNISSMDIVRDFMSNILSTEKSTFISSIISSQVISNVPATILISAFTPYYRELLLGVNIGGLGTLIASLASVISYKLYIKDNEKSSREYMKVFTIYNILALIIITAIISVVLFL